MKRLNWFSSFRVTCALGLLPFSLSQSTDLAWAAKGEIYEINTVLMETTFRIQGQAADGTTKTATIFIVGKPSDGSPDNFRHVIVTAAHVLEDIIGDEAILHLRKSTGVNKWERVSQSLKIRDKGMPLWTKHPDADVAAMYIDLPNGLIPRQLGTSLLAGDEDLHRFEIHPGDDVSCLGYPLGVEGGKEGFPVLRSGKISSYPLLPTKDKKTFLFDFEIFGGNSGGPVYFTDSNRFYEQKTHLGQTIQLLVGVVSKQHYVGRRNIKDGTLSEIQYLKLAEVVHASLITETIYLIDGPFTFPIEFVGAPVRRLVPYRFSEAESD